MPKRLPTTFLRRPTKRRAAQQQIVLQVKLAVSDRAQVQILEVVEDQVEWRVGMEVWRSAIQRIIR